MASSTPDSGAGAGAGDDLDQLLDSALDDFTNLDLAAAAAPQSGGDASSSAGREACAGAGDGAAGSEATEAARGEAAAVCAGEGSYASEALEKLTRETREALRGLETATSTTAAGGEDGERLDSDAMVEEFMKQFEDMGGSQDMESIVETMMQQLLSKEILHEPMKEIVERYPKWLEENKDKISKEEYERYNNQLELMVTLNEVYENDPDNFSKVVDIMQKMQECGQPPSDIVQSIVPDLDLSNLGQLTLLCGMFVLLYLEKWNRHFRPQAF